MMASIFASNTLEAQDQCQEIISTPWKESSTLDQYTQLIKIGEDLDKLCQQPLFQQDDTENARKFLDQYQRIETTLSTAKSLPVTACERLIGFILQPEYIDNAKSQYQSSAVGSKVLRHRGMQQRMAQSLCLLLGEQ